MRSSIIHSFQPHLCSLQFAAVQCQLPGTKPPLYHSATLPFLTSEQMVYDTENMKMTGR